MWVRGRTTMWENILLPRVYGDRRLKRLDTILPQLKRELKRKVSSDNLSQCCEESGYSNSNYKVRKVEIGGRLLTEEEALRFARF